MDTTSHPYFIESDAAGSRRETAVLLVGTAEEEGIDQRDIRTTRTGFRISQALADALGLDTSEADEDGTLPTPDLGEPEEGARSATPDFPESEAARPEHEHESLGDEVPDPEADGADTREGVAAEPTNPVEAETPVFVEEDGQTKVAPANAEQPFEPSDHNIDAVKAHVEENPDSAAAVLAREQETENRKTLVRWLNEFIESDNSNTDNEE